MSKPQTAADGTTSAVSPAPIAPKDGPIVACSPRMSRHDELSPRVPVAGQGETMNEQAAGPASELLQLSVEELEKQFITQRLEAMGGDAREPWSYKNDGDKLTYVAAKNRHKCGLLVHSVSTGKQDQQQQQPFVAGDDDALWSRALLSPDLNMLAEVPKDTESATERFRREYELSSRQRVGAF